MATKLNLKSLLSETKKMINIGGHSRNSFFKEESYRQVCLSYSDLDSLDRYQYVSELSKMHDYSTEKWNSLFNKINMSDEYLQIKRLYGIKESLQPKYRGFFINLGRVPDGIKLLVDLRSDIMQIQTELSLMRNKNEAKLPRDLHDISMKHSIGSDLEGLNTLPETKNPKQSENNFFNYTTRGIEDSDLLNERNRVIASFLHTDNAHSLQILNNELKDLITVWFAGGFCQLQRITWESSCHLLQRVSELEAVHPVRGWIDMKRRVGPYRRCHVFTHPCMPGEPVVILHTALCSTVPSTIREIVSRNFEKTSVTLQSKDLKSRSRAVSIIEDEDASQIKAAVFYSISSPHQGLNGIDLGNTLIKRVANLLHSEYPTLSVFCTLSPVPGFRVWLQDTLAKCILEQVHKRVLLDTQETNPSSAINRLLTPHQICVLHREFNTEGHLKDLLTQLDLLLSGISRGSKWSSDINNSTTDLTNLKSPVYYDADLSTTGTRPDIEEVAIAKTPPTSTSTTTSNQSPMQFNLMKWLLCSIAAKYLCNEKYRGYARDSVANFHLKNGAEIWKIHWLADSSPRGIQNSYGVMVSYRYNLDRTGHNSQLYLDDKFIQMSTDVKQMLTGLSNESPRPSSDE